MKHAGIGPIAVHLPAKIETNDDLKAMNPKWDVDLIASKTGIHQRHIVADDECSSDLGYAAAKKLMEENDIDPASIDFLLFCTQTPDYALPTSACLLQNRLGLGTHCGALDFNLGCSGYVYGLSLADGLIRSGAVKRVLFITAETYTKLIATDDRSLRTIFGDAGTATLIEANDEPSLWGFKFGTDGTGADTLIAHCGGFRKDETVIPPRKRKRWKSDLYMDGPALINFTVGAIPDLVDQILTSAQMSKEQVDYYLFHQATFKMLEQLRQRLDVPAERMPIQIEEIGNTVSCTLPILIKQLRDSGDLNRRNKHVMVGFGVGWSWAGCVWQDMLQKR